MGALAGFLLGYWLGTKAGKHGMEEMISAGKQIAKSDEFKSAMAGATQMAGSMLSAGASMAAGRLGGGAHEAPAGKGRASMRAV